MLKKCCEKVKVAQEELSKAKTEDSEADVSNEEAAVDVAKSNATKMIKAFLTGMQKKTKVISQPPMKKQKVEETTKMGSPSEKKIGDKTKPFDAINYSSRDFSIKGKVSFVSVGEITKQGEPKKKVTVEDESKKKISLLMVGTKQAAACKDIKHGCGITIYGMRPCKPKSNYHFN